MLSDSFINSYSRVSDPGPECPLVNSFLASSDFCLLLITFANSLDQDQD